MFGPDHSSGLDPLELKNLVKGVRKMKKKESTKKNNQK